ncbi:10843_t:CDS:2 [Entrophospora sp. SA101]|nr:10843_t:CDS:2 [Entrophospora sp. SA101]
MGAAYGTAKSGIGIAGAATFKPELIMKTLLPVIMSGILAVYGLVMAVLITGSSPPKKEGRRRKKEYKKSQEIKTLWCLIYGDPLTSVFPIDIDTNNVHWTFKRSH